MIILYEGITGAEDIVIIYTAWFNISVFYYIRVFSEKRDQFPMGIADLKTLP